MIDQDGMVTITRDRNAPFSSQPISSEASGAVDWSWWTVMSQYARASNDCSGKSPRRYATVLRGFKGFRLGCQWHGSPAPSRAISSTIIHTKHLSPTRQMFLTRASDCVAVTASVVVAVVVSERCTCIVAPPAMVIGWLFG